MMPAAGEEVSAPGDIHDVLSRRRSGELEFSESGMLPDFERPIGELWNGDTVRIELPQHLGNGLRERSRMIGEDISQVLLAACGVLVHRSVGREEVSIRVPISQWQRAEAQSPAGSSPDFVLLRTKVSDNPPFLDLVRRFREAGAAAIGPDMSMLQGGAYPIQFSHRSELAAAADTASHSAPDVHFFSGESRGTLVLACEYCAGLYRRESAESWLKIIGRILEGVVEDPSLRILEIPLIDAADEARILAFAGARSPYPRDQTIGGIFEEVAARFASKPAVVQEGRMLTYEELLWRARAVARELEGIECGTFVGILTTGTMDVIPGLIGILLAGGAYVPIDPRLPRERISYVLRDAKIRAVVADATAAFDFDGCRVVRPPAISGMVPAVSVSAIAATDPAYALFTSGSTGQPKGVVVPHRAVVRLVKGADYIRFSDAEVFLQAAPLAFDASTFEIWGPLLHGGTLVMPVPGACALDWIADSIRERGVTTLWLTSGLFQMMVDQHLDALGGLKNLLAGGDVLSVPHVRRAHAALPETRLINGYGPTENTTFTTCHTISSDDLRGLSIPIGRPIPNSTAFILDAAGRLVPVGIPGELHAGGDGLAIGYLNDPDNTRTKFFESKLPGAGRLYRTGDLARWRPDGTIEYLGRLDRQVKVRGVRIEPAEVENAIAAFPHVAWCRVGICGRTSSSKILVAWVLPSGSLDRNALSEYLSSRLPTFLRPDAIVFVESFPLDRNGKIDLDALPEPGHASRVKSDPPVTPTEKRLAKIWEELLGVQSIGRDDQFFHLGGHSLLALMMFHRMSSEFDLALPVSTLLRASTLRTLGSLIDCELAGGSDEESGPQPVLAVLRSEGSREPVFFVHHGDGGVLVYAQMLEGYNGDHPVLAIESPGLRSAGSYSIPPVEKVAELYLRLVRKRQPRGPYFLAGFSYGGLVAYEMALQLTAAGERVEFLSVIDINVPGVPLVKVGLAERLRRYLDRRSATTPAQRAFLSLSYFVKRLASRILPLDQNEPEPDPGDLCWELREAHAATMAAYRPGKYPGRMVLFRAINPGGRVLDFPPDMGWAGLVEGGLEVVPVAGSHSTIFQRKNIWSISCAFLNALNHAGRSGTSRG